MNNKKKRLTWLWIVIPAGIVLVFLSVLYFIRPLYLFKPHVTYVCHNFCDVSGETLNLFEHSSPNLLKNKGFYFGKTSSDNYSDTVYQRDFDRPDKMRIFLKKLSPSTQYKVQSFMIHEDGRIFTSPILYFTTLEPTLPSVESLLTQSITPTSAWIGGIVTDDGGLPVTGCGILLSPSSSMDSDVTTYSSKVSNVFAEKLLPIKPGTQYYYCLFAQNECGTSYSDICSFSTPDIDEYDKEEDMTNIHVKDVTIEMVYVQGGEFQMGGFYGRDTAVYEDNYPPRTVSVSDYYIGRYEVTQEIWEKVMGYNESPVRSKTLPVTAVNYERIQEFINTLNILTGRHFRLPTEAEWEYAAFGGNESRQFKYSGSDNLDDVGWFGYNSGETPHPVGQKAPNELFLYDMAGNISENCSDWYSEDPTVITSSGEEMVSRGGGYAFSRNSCMSSFRGSVPPLELFADVGLRLAMDAK